jgi:DHA1 family multidrug resistance protein-like MFS transporter
MRSPFIPFFLGDLGADATAQAHWASAIAAGGALTSMIAAPLWGVLADRVGRRPMVVRAMIFGAVTVGLMSVATAPWQLFGLRLVEGATTGTVAACAALIAATVPAERLGFALGLMHTSVFSGNAIGPLLGGFLADWLGYRATYATCGVLIGIGAVIVILLVRERFIRPRPESRRPGATGGWNRRRWLALLGPVVVVMLGVMFVLRAASQAMQPIFPLFIGTLPQTALSDAQATGIVFGAQGVAAAITSVWLGALGDRIGHRRVLLLAAAGSGLASLPMALATDVWQLVVLQALFGLFAGGLIPSTNALVSRATSPAHRGAIFGLMTGAGGLGSLVGPLAAAGVATSAGYGAAFVMVALALLVTAAALVVAFRRVPGLVAR